MIRTLLLFLIAGSLFSRASDPITATYSGASAAVSQPHVTAELIPENTAIQAGQSFGVVLHLHTDPDWHTYWINPGDSGLATRIDWTLPPGFTAGPIQWPTPEKHAMGPLTTYGYGGDVYLLTTITPPKSELPKHLDIKAHATWLVCQEECIPGEADLTLTLDTTPLNLRLPVDNKNFFAAARARLPVLNTLWDLKASYGDRADFNSTGAQGLNLVLNQKSGVSMPLPKNLSFFPKQSNVLSNDDAAQGHVLGSEKGFYLSITLQQNGEKPDKLSGILISDQPLIGNSKAVYISEFPVTASGIPKVAVAGYATEPPQGPAAAISQPWLIAVLGAAFVGGLILNLMPCVLPVLSLKVFSLMRHAGENPRAAWVQGVAFTVGVVISFWVLAGLLLALRAAGNQLGWGFQMQSPGFVLALIFIFFLLALNLFGVFELGTSLVGVDAKATSHVGGATSSFLNGALATVAATPCTAPFMGSSLGFAAQQPPFVALLIFTFLALGMATPYLLLTIFPGALRFAPKPGAWMEAFKQFMGFLLMATVIFLVYVFGALVGQDQVPWLLVVLLLVGVAAWIYGHWGTPSHSVSIRVIALIVSLGFLAYTLNWGVVLAQATPPEMSTSSNSNGQGNLTWQPWSPASVDQALAAGRPVFVDFTAAWCLSCKVNERLALDTDSVRAAFAKKNVALFLADWTHSDPEISKTLRQFNRDGVPLYLLYSPRDKTPRVLPEVLTPTTMLKALDQL
jgi:thiol:disulfide interchange protein DsbD